MRGMSFWHTWQKVGHVFRPVMKTCICCLARNCSLVFLASMVSDDDYWVVVAGGGAARAMLFLRFSSV